MSAAVPDIYGMDGRSQPHPSSVTVGLYFYRDMPHTPIHEIEAADSGRPYINPMVACLAEMASRKAAEGVEAWHTETREMHLNRVRKIVKAVGITAATGLFAGLSFAARQPADGMIAGSIIGLADLSIIRFLGDTHKSMAATRARISQEKARSYARIVQQDIYRIFTEIYTPQQQGSAGS